MKRTKDPKRAKQVTYRTSLERHKLLKQKSNELERDVQEILDSAVDTYLKPEDPNRAPAPEPVREAQALIAVLHSNLDHIHYAEFWMAINKLLAIVKQDFGDK